MDNKKFMKQIICIMRKCLLTFFFIIFTDNLYSRQRFYCEVKGVEKEITSGLKIIFDFGIQVSYDMWGDLNCKLKFVDKNGDGIKFNSMVYAANYMMQRGWPFQ